MTRKMYLAVAFDRDGNMEFVPTLSTYADYKQVLPAEMRKLGYDVPDDSEALYFAPWDTEDDVTYWGFVKNGDFRSEHIKVMKKEYRYVLDTKHQEKRNERRSQFGGLETV